MGTPPGQSRADPAPLRRQHTLRYRIEGPAGAQRLLAITPFGPDVTVSKARPILDKPREHVVRAEFILRGKLTAPLREVPSSPTRCNRSSTP